jgi:protein-S-isoprenylcysteine O-methyltransferase Ste14
MSKSKYSYKYDIIASILAIFILIGINFFKKGENEIFRIAGIIILFLSVVLWILPIFTLKKYGMVNQGEKYFETNVIVKKGIYSIIRHPQYLAYILFVLGFAFLSQHLIIFALAIVSIVFFYIHTIEEEKDLKARHTREYTIYSETVPRFNLIKGTINKIITKKSTSS